jgi:hypothetical protein
MLWKISAGKLSKLEIMAAKTLELCCWIVIRGATEVGESKTLGERRRVIDDG